MGTSSSSASKSRGNFTRVSERVRSALPDRLKRAEQTLAKQAQRLNSAIVETRQSVVQARKAGNDTARQAASAKLTKLMSRESQLQRRYNRIRRLNPDL